MSLADIRAKLQAQANRNQPQQQTQTDNAIYPHWNIEEGNTAIVRFLPDGDANNSFFWIERNIIKLPFTGAVGGDQQKEYIVQVPCMEMYGESCPILTEVRTWYKDDTLKDIANKYWKKRSYLFQGFVRQNPIVEDSAPENPIRRFVITNQIFNVIKASLMDPEIEELPTDYIRGLDFRIVKTSKGGYADYSTSGWARKESKLTEAEQAALDVHGLFNLKDFLPKKPSESELRIIKEMFEASVDGRPYDPIRWGAYYKPWGLDVSSNRRDDDDSEPTKVTYKESVKSASKVAEKVSNSEQIAPWEDVSEPVSVTTPVNTSATTDKAADIIAMIRSRQKTV